VLDELDIWSVRLVDVQEAIMKCLSKDLHYERLFYVQLIFELRYSSVNPCSGQMVRWVTENHRLCRAMTLTLDSHTTQWGLRIGRRRCRCGPMTGCCCQRCYHRLWNATAVATPT